MEPTAVDLDNREVDSSDSKTIPTGPMDWPFEVRGTDWSGGPASEDRGIDMMELTF